MLTSRRSSRSSTMWARRMTWWMLRLLLPTLSDGGCHGYYQGVIFAYGGDYYSISCLAADADLVRADL